MEIFNTTGQTIALDGMEIISRTDNNSDGVVEIDWQLAVDLTGREIAPYSFFLVAETGVSGENGVSDVETDMDLATGEGGFGRAGHLRPADGRRRPHGLRGLRSS